MPTPPAGQFERGRSFCNRTGLLPLLQLRDVARQLAGRLDHPVRHDRVALNSLPSILTSQYSSHANRLCAHHVVVEPISHENRLLGLNHKLL